MWCVLVSVTLHVVSRIEEDAEIDTRQSPSWMRTGLYHVIKLFTSKPKVILYHLPLTEVRGTHNNFDINDFITSIAGGI